MKTIVHASIDGFEIVLGFGNADGFIDPQATYAKIGELIRETGEAKAMQAASDALASRKAEYRELYGQYDIARMQGNQFAMQRTGLAIQSKQTEIDEAAAALPDLVTAFEARRAKLFADHAEYAKPPQGEDLIADDAATALQGKFALKEGYALLMDGTTVPDLRGRVCWTQKPWKRMEILKLGQDWPAGAIADDQLTDAQRQDIAVQIEADRVAGLTLAQKAEEVKAAQIQAATDAATLRSKLEITGDPSALEKSQAAYQQALAAISAKYGM